MITIEIPFQIKRNGSRKLISATKCTAKPKCVPNKALLKALTKACYWQKLIDEGKFKNKRELAKKFNMHLEAVVFIMRMNLLAPDIKKAILDGTQPRTMNLERFKKPWSDVWQEQRQCFGFID